MPNKTISLSIEGELLEKIDEVRGDVTRSRFVQRILERVFSEQPVRPKNELEGG
jgi:metal-responsive CopG/Arc/MetJ family transcriptional regulator